MSPAKHIILFLLDGCRADALALADTPTIDQVMAQGAFTLKAQTIMPSITLPCHTAMFYSVPAEIHGVTSNTWQQPAPPLISLSEVIYQAGSGVAAFYTWEQLRDLARPGSLDFAYYQRLDTPNGDSILDIAVAAADYIVEEKPTFTFIYLEAIDSTGHHYGWLSDPYLAAVNKSDQATGIVLQALRSEGIFDDTLCLIQADHGGHEQGHGTDMAEDMTIPWIISGPGVRRGHQITSPVNIIDTAPTLLHGLGLAQPAAWQGNVVTEAFV